jgi:hypothetical protein
MVKNKGKYLLFTMILIAGLLIASCQAQSEPEPAEPSGNPTFIQTVEVEQRGDEYYAIVTGWYPDACSETGDIVQDVEGDTIHLTIFSTKPDNVACAQMLTDFSEEILLGTGNLAPGEYTIIVNEDQVETTFNLF